MTSKCQAERHHRYHSHHRHNRFTWHIIDEDDKANCKLNPAPRALTVAINSYCCAKCLDCIKCLLCSHTPRKLSSLLTTARSFINYVAFCGAVEPKHGGRDPDNSQGERGERGERELDKARKAKSATQDFEGMPACRERGGVGPASLRRQEELDGCDRGRDGEKIEVRPRLVKAFVLPSISLLNKIFKPATPTRAIFIFYFSRIILAVFDPWQLITPPPGCHGNRSCPFSNFEPRFLLGVRVEHDDDGYFLRHSFFLYVVTCSQPNRS